MKKLVLFFLIAFSLNTSAQSALMGNFQRNQWVGADTDESMVLNITEITDKTDMACCFNGNAKLHYKYRLPQISTLSGEAWIRDGEVSIKMELDIKGADVEYYGRLTSLSDGRLLFNGDMSIGYNGRGKEIPLKIYFAKNAQSESFKKNAQSESFKVNGINYTITNKIKRTVEVTYQGDYNRSDYNEYTGSITIPETITYSGTIYSVTSIGNYAFYGCDSLASITIPNSVTSIGISAFSGCRSLTSITIPNSVTSIGNSAFSGCRSLTSITIPNSVTSISWWAFSGCESLTSITIPNSVTSISNFAFSGCRSLTSITIPNFVTSIGNAAFSGCRSMTSITIPNSVTSIGSHAFFDCESLETITLPNSVTSIGYGAFSCCYSLESITIPNSVTSIGDNAFSGCRSLTSITIPNSVTSIGNSAFYNCSGLKSITLSLPAKTSTDKFVISLSPKNSTLKQLQWTSDNPSVATVDQGGYVTAINVGTATITATTTDGSNISASYVITVIN